MAIDPVVRTYTPPAPQESLPEPEQNIHGAASNEADLEPIEVRESQGSDILLESLGIDDSVKNMPPEDQENLKETKQYLFDIIKTRGDSPTMGAFKQALNDIKAEFGLTDTSDPSVILERIGGVVKAWKSLSFVNDPHEKRRIFMKLARSTSGKDMNKIVLDEMEHFSVWR
jgi:hypothetical protein